MERIVQWGKVHKMGKGKFNLDLSFLPSFFLKIPNLRFESGRTSLMIGHGFLIIILKIQIFITLLEN
jgi:hypothetical protein